MREAFKPLLVIGLVLVALAAFYVAPAILRSKELIDWRHDFAAARREAESANKPLLVYFTAEWCGPCQQMKRTTFADRSVERAIADKYLPVKIDVDREAALAKQIRIEVLPTFKIVDRDQRVLREESGALDVEAFVAWLRKPDQPLSTTPATRP